MESRFGVAQGIWKVIQNGTTLEMELLQYGHVIETWQGEKLYSFEELNEIMLQKSYERRGED